MGSESECFANIPENRGFSTLTYDAAILALFDQRVPYIFNNLANIGGHVIADIEIWFRIYEGPHLFGQNIAHAAAIAKARKLCAEQLLAVRQRFIMFQIGYQ